MTRRPLAVPGVLAALTLSACHGIQSGDPIDPPATAEALTAHPWRVTALGDEAVTDAAPPTLAFDLAGQLNGTGGVNRYFANVDWERPGRMTVSQIGSTKMAGPPELMEQERTLFQCLREVDRYTLTDGTLRLLDGDRVRVTAVEGEPAE